MIKTRILTGIFYITCISINPVAAAADDRMGSFTQPTNSVDRYRTLDVAKFHEDRGLNRGISLKVALNMINIDAASVYLSGQPVVTWDKVYSTLPDYDERRHIIYSESKLLYEMSKLGVTKASAGVSFLGLSLDLEYKEKLEALNRGKKTTIYSLKVCDFPKIKLAIPTEHITVVPDIVNKIKEAVQTEDIYAFGQLVSVFNKYGFCVPTQFLLGGRIGFTEMETFSSTEEVKAAATEFNINSKANVMSVSAKLNVDSSTSEKKESTQTTKVLNLIRIGGSTKNNTIEWSESNIAEWASSLESCETWKVIDQSDFFPIIYLLEKELQESCRKLISRYWRGNWEDVSLPALEEVNSRLTQPIKALPYRLISQEERDYINFMRGKLVYRPNEGSNNNMVELPIAKLTNPISDEFNLSRCGDSGQYLSINTGYRTCHRPENANKLEIWFVLRFVVERDLAGPAKHLQPIWAQWPERNPVGIFFTWGGWNGANHMTWYDYLTTQDLKEQSNGENLRLKNVSARAHTPFQSIELHHDVQTPGHGAWMQKFHFFITN